MSDQGKKQAPSLLKNIGSAGLAAVITVTFIHPIDVVKTRLQTQGEAGRATKQYGGIMGVIKTSLAEEGAGAFYKGIGAAWLREASYTSLRIGLYDPIKTAIGADKKDAGIIKKFIAGAAAGALGSIVGNPFDVLKTQMMANSESSEGFVYFAKKINETQGFSGFYKGLEANIMRAMILNATKMGSYDICKGYVKSIGFGDGLSCQFMSAFAAGFFMAITVSPFDMIRTRLMNQPHDAKIYSGFADCFSKILTNEGPKGFYKGFIPIWSRFAPTTTLQLIIFEQLRKVMGLGAL